MLSERSFAGKRRQSCNYISCVLTVFNLNLSDTIFLPSPPERASDLV